MVNTSFRAVFFIVGILLAFVATNIETTLGVIYIGMLGIAFLTFITDKQPTWVIERKPNRLKSAILAYGAYIAVSVLSAVGLAIFKLTDNAQVGLSSVSSAVEILAQAELALANSVPLNIFSFGVLIPIVETILFFGIMLEILQDWTKHKPKIIDIKTIGMIALISGAFTAFHFSAKGFRDEALFMVFIFSVVSIILVLYEGQLMSAIMLHILWNTSALLVKFGIVTSTSILVINGAILLGLIVIINLTSKAFKTQRIGS